MNNLIKLSKFKTEYTDFIFDQIAQFRTEKDEKLLKEINPFDKNNLETISYDLVLDPNKKFSNRFFLGKYIYETLRNNLKKEEIKMINNDPDFWCWLSIIYFDQLTKNYSAVSRMEHYIPAVGRFRRKIGGSFSIAHRHSVREPYRLYYQFGEESKIYFNQRNIHQQGNIIESIRSRKECSSNPQIHEFLKIKYMKEDGYAKPGTATTSNEEKGTGISSTVRLGKLYRRINVTYIGPLLNAIELSERLGPGFEIN
tara:strand:+ start:3019 stop:3783 length:765 start_codon:yes stop_codon:yes gene_type:complete